jgi:hypothetical protein
MITGIPNYKSPIEQSMRCLCGLRYLVLMSDSIGDAEGRARGRAELISARFIDARVTPFLLCDCGQFLDFVEERSSALVM